MRDIEVEFLDEYKKLDNLIKDKFSSEQGVTEYINRMKANDYFASHLISGWGSTYRQLIYIRKVRNDIVHENYSDCEPGDIEYVLDFYKELMDLKDPLTLYYIKQKKDAERARKKAAKTQNIQEEEISIKKEESESKGLGVFQLFLLLILLAAAIMIVMKLYSR